MRQQAVLLFASSEPIVTKSSDSTIGHLIFNLGSKDNPNLPMPAGTTVAIQPVGSVSCSIVKFTPTTVPNVLPSTNSSEDLSTTHDVFLPGCMAGDTMIITVTSPSGVSSSKQLTL